MFIVIFQLQISAAQIPIAGTYYTQLLPILHTQSGFISETPYASPYTEGKQLTVARFVDEAAETAWRLQHDHLKIEKKGREKVFDDYRLRVGNGGDVIGFAFEGASGGDSASGMDGGKRRIVSIYEQPHQDVSTPPSHDLEDLLEDSAKGAAAGLEIAAGVADAEVYQGEKSVVWICGWKSVGAAKIFAESVRRIEGDGLTFVKVKRDYGKNDRKEAPDGAVAAQDASVKD